GFFGIGGFNISCIANYDEARVELTLAKSDKDRNKSAYDYLYSQKNDTCRIRRMQKSSRSGKSSMKRMAQDRIHESTYH
ncbi:MAG: DUF4268 domain-containing protein, partial [Oscillospiraceae bacterium]|nr:DUF4268 domain-containing protein [Oscillospiraceae bacterium]